MTQMHAARGDWPVRPKPPFIPGYEGVGHVVGLGKNVRRVNEGDRVGIPWLHSGCGYCPYCRTGWETPCAERQNSGYSINGSFAEYALADPNYVGPVPAQLGDGAAGSGRGAAIRRRGQGCRAFLLGFLDNINDILDRMEHGGIEGRIVLNLT